MKRVPISSVGLHVYPVGRSWIDDKLICRPAIRHASRSLYFNAGRHSRRRAQFSRSIAWFRCGRRRR